MKNKTRQCGYYAMNTEPEIMRNFCAAIINSGIEYCDSHPLCIKRETECVKNGLVGDMCDFLDIDKSLIIKRMERSKNKSLKGA